MAPLELSEAAVKFGNKHGIPVIVDIRDLWPEIYEEIVPKWGRILVKPYIRQSKRRLRDTLLNSTSLIVVTEKFLNYGQELINKKRENDKVFYTSYPPIVTENNAGLNTEWLDPEIKKTDFIVTFMGNFGKQFILKPIIEVAEMLKEYNDIKFVLCGDGEKLTQIEKETCNLPNVLLPGWIGKLEINSLLSASSVGIAPYRTSINFTHNIPNKFGEYLSFSLPVLLGVKGNMAELVQEYHCGKLYTNAEELKQSILELYENKKIKLNMAQNAKRLYNEKFNSNIVYKGMDDFIVSRGKINNKE